MADKIIELLTNAGYDQDARIIILAELLGAERTKRRTAKYREYQRETQKKHRETDREKYNTYHRERRARIKATATIADPAAETAAVIVEP